MKSLALCACSSMGWWDPCLQTILSTPFVRFDATERCGDGDVRTADHATGTPASALDKATTPEVYYKGEWHPVCGHGFWDNGNGATTLCKQLGFGAGDVVGGHWPGRQPAGVYPKDAMPVGECGAGEPLTNCTGGRNGWGNFSAGGGTAGRGWCHQGNKVRMAITCSGGSAHRTSSCRAQGTPLSFPAGSSARLGGAAGDNDLVAG